MRELFAFPLSRIERRLQVVNRHASVLQDGSDSGPISEQLTARACDCPFDLERWQTPARLGLLRRPLDHLARDVVPVPTRPLVGAARVERLTIFVEQLSRQRTRHRSSVDGSMMRGLLSQLALHAFPELSIHDCRTLAGMP